MEDCTKRLAPYKVVLFVAAIVGVVALCYAMRDVFGALTASVFFYYVLDPIATWFTGRKIGGRVTISRLTAVIIATLVGVVAITLFIMILIPPITDQVQRFTKNLPSFQQHVDATFKSVQQRYRSMELPPEVQDSIRSGIDNVVSEFSVIVRHAAEATAGLFSQIVLIFMIPFLTIYMLLEKKDVKLSIVRFFPRKWQEEADQVLSEASATLRGYITGQLTLSVIMALLMTIGLGLLGVKAPLLLGLIAGITKMIPVVGIILGCIPAAFSALSSSPVLALWVIIIFTAIQLLENKIVLPVLLSRYVSLSPLTILLALVVGEQLGGLLGMFLATPVAAVLRVLYVHVRRKYD